MHVNPLTRFLICLVRLPSMVVNPLILEGINSLDVPKGIKPVLRDIIEAEDNIKLGSDHRSAIISIKKILEKHAGDDKVVRDCDKHS